MHPAFAIVIGALVSLAATAGIMRTVGSQNLFLFLVLWLGFGFGVIHLLAEKDRT